MPLDENFYSDQIARLAVLNYFPGREDQMPQLLELVAALREAVPDDRFLAAKVITEILRESTVSPMPAEIRTRAWSIAHPGEVPGSQPAGVPGCSRCGGVGYVSKRVQIDNPDRPLLHGKEYDIACECECRKAKVGA